MMPNSVRAQGGSEMLLLRNSFLHLIPPRIFLGSNKKIQVMHFPKLYSVLYRECNVFFIKYFM